MPHDQRLDRRRRLLGRALRRLPAACPRSTAIPTSYTSTSFGFPSDRISRSRRSVGWPLRAAVAWRIAAPALVYPSASRAAIRRQTRSPPLSPRRAPSPERWRRVYSTLPGEGEDRMAIAERGERFAHDEQRIFLDVDDALLPRDPAVSRGAHVHEQRHGQFAGVRAARRLAGDPPPERRRAPRRERVDVFVNVEFGSRRADGRFGRLGADAAARTVSAPDGRARHGAPAQPLPRRGSPASAGALFRARPRPGFALHATTEIPSGYATPTPAGRAGAV